MPQESAVVLRYHLQNVASRFTEQWTYYHDVDLFCNSQHQRRLAFFQIPYPYNNFIDREIDRMYDHCDRIFVIGSELHPRTVNFIRRYDRSKIVFFTCGFLQPRPLNSEIFPFLDWFTTTVHFYKNVQPSTLFDLTPHTVKPLMFDALLGRKKPHRDQAWNFLNEKNLLDKGIATYINDLHINFDAGDRKKWIWPDGQLTDAEQAQWTVDHVNYHGHRMSLSQIIPVNIYNQTAYSLVCETNFDNDFVFFTEKTIKPLIARRLFIMIGHQHTLARLRELGFRTFGGIIDESYDAVEPVTQRHQMALEQLEWLCQQDQSKILAECQDIVIHNYNLIMGKDWYHLFREPLARLLFSQ
jgi:hypothetical protein